MKVGYVDQAAADLFRDLLLPGTARDCCILGLTEDDVACGALALRDLSGAGEIVSLYVAPDYRRRGGGRLLLEAAEALGADRWDELWLDLTLTAPDAVTLAPFLTAVGWQRREASARLWGMSLGELSALPFFQKDGKGAIPFSRLPEFLRRSAYQIRAAAGVALMDRNDFMDALDPEVSMAAVRDDQVIGFAALRPYETGVVELAWVVSEDPRVLPSLLRSAAAALREKYPPETLVAMETVTDPSLQLKAALLPGARALEQSWIRPLGREEAGSHE